MNLSRRWVERRVAAAKRAPGQALPEVPRDPDEKEKVKKRGGDGLILAGFRESQALPGQKAAVLPCADFAELISALSEVSRFR